MPITAELPEVQTSLRGGRYQVGWDTNTALAVLTLTALLFLMGFRIGPLKFPRP